MGTPEKGTTLKVAKKQFDPLPEDHSFTYSATGKKPLGGETEFNEPIDLSDKHVSEFNCLEQ